MVFSRLESALKSSPAAFQSQSLYYLNKHKTRYLHDLKRISKINANNILELGAYPFHLTFLLKERGYDVVAVDKLPSRAESLIKNAKLNVVKCDIEHEVLPFRDNSFDLVLMHEVFEHLKEPIHALLEANRVLKPSGVLLLTTVNVYSINHMLKYLLGRGPMTPAWDEYARPYSFGSMGHVREYTTDEVREFLINTNFTSVKQSFDCYPQNRRWFHPLLNLIHKNIPKLRPYQIAYGRKGAKRSYYLAKLKEWH